jgi:4-carboxymuconolactone decarboxylase
LGNVNEVADKPGGLNRSMQHWLAVYSPVFESPRQEQSYRNPALIASGQVAQITYHLNRAMNNGLTQPQASEVIAQIAFYAGWPNAFSVLPVVKEVLEKRQK